jgi:hypothetical protein
MNVVPEESGGKLELPISGSQARVWEPAELGHVSRKPPSQNQSLSIAARYMAAVHEFL